MLVWRCQLCGAIRPDPEDAYVHFLSHQPVEYRALSIVKGEARRVEAERA